MFMFIRPTSPGKWSSAVVSKSKLYIYCIVFYTSFFSLSRMLHSLLIVFNIFNVNTKPVVN